MGWNSGCGLVEHFFFDAIIVRAFLAAEAPHVVERLIAIPACTLRLQPGHALGSSRSRLSVRFSSVIDLVCIIHDSAAITRYQTIMPRGRVLAKV
jgi:hypothetical protein